MNRTRPYYEVCWSPKDTSKFLTANCEEIRLYEVVNLSSDGKLVHRASRLSESTAAKFIWKTPDIKGIRCIDWNPKPTHKGTLLAVGCENGEVVLTGYGNDDLSVRGLVLNAKSGSHQVRPCNDVRWHPRDLKLACAFERSRGEWAVQLFDIEQLQRAESSLSGDPPTCKPLAQFAHQEASQSVCFAPLESMYPSAVVCSTSGRKLRVFDLREGSQAAVATVSGNTSAVHALTFDPYNANRLASVGTDCMCIWDLRNLNQPIITVRDAAAQGISKLRWCPNRSNQLTAIRHDCNQLTLFTVRDMMQTTESGRELHSSSAMLDGSMHSDRQLHGQPQQQHDQTVIRQLQPRGQLKLRSFSWHPEAENRMLIYDGDDEITDYTIIDQITLNWAPSSEIIWTHGKRLVHRLHERDALYSEIDPLASTVRRRALKGFGCVKNGTNICLDASLVKDQRPLLSLHHWLKQLDSLGGEEGSRPLVGIFHLLENIQGSTSQPGKLQLDNNIKYLSCYDHQARRQAINLLTAIEGPYRGEDDWAQRAVAALFQLDMRKAMEYLEMPSKTDQDLNSGFVALAISGYSEQKGSTWREMCASLKPRIRNPYLGAIFSFLMSTSDDYNQVLECPIALQDKLMFACRFLTDLKLYKFVKEQTAEYVQQGNLEGILLTGLQATNNKLNTQLLDLLQNYVDRTADVQTAAAIAVVTRDPQVLTSDRAKRWIESYRQLLNQWRLWTERALFDCAMSPLASRAIAPQIRVHCNFCRKAISAHSDTRGKPSFRTLPPAQRITCCPSCRKPLPRCAMCLTNMGTPISRQGRDTREGRETIVDQNSGGAMANRGDPSQFSRWFTWCQSCLHGGHTQHMAHWFEKHEKCPVAGCQCMCASVDACCGQTPLPHFEKRLG